MHEIEKRTGEKFETGEVVHAFTEQSEILINGLTVPYCQPSAINDDRHIKVVFFKEALSTGWDCPRAECMMSFRVARDATYIAQLLGRMIRTPRGERVEVDETLNYVHLYLPNFDKDTVKHVVDKLNEEEITKEEYEQKVQEVMDKYGDSIPDDFPIKDILDAGY